MSYLASFTIQWQKILFKTANMNILTKNYFFLNFVKILIDVQKQRLESESVN